MPVGRVTQAQLPGRRERREKTIISLRALRLCERNIKYIIFPAQQYFRTSPTLKDLLADFLPIFFQGATLGFRGQPA